MPHNVQRGMLSGTRLRKMAQVNKELRENVAAPKALTKKKGKIRLAFYLANIQIFHSYLYKIRSCLLAVFKCGLLCRYNPVPTMAFINNTFVISRFGNNLES